MRNNKNFRTFFEESNDRIENTLRYLGNCNGIGEDHDRDTNRELERDFIENESRWTAKAEVSGSGCGGTGADRSTGIRRRGALANKRVKSVLRRNRSYYEHDNDYSRDRHFPAAHILGYTQSLAKNGVKVKEPADTS